MGTITSTRKTVAELDKGLRHTPGMTSNQFISEYCATFRPYAHATIDDSLNEFEKLITQVLGMLIYHERRADILGMEVDPRDFVEGYEDLANEAALKHDEMRALVKSAIPQNVIYI